MSIADHTKNVWDDLDNEIDQVWAESVTRWKLGEKLHLIGELENEARIEQELHRETSSKEGMILDYLNKPVPEDWPKWYLDKRRMFLNGLSQGEMKLVQRDPICALKIWCELFNGSPKDFSYTDADEINEIICSMPEWSKTQNSLRFGYCGKQRGFQRIDLAHLI